MWLPGGEGPGKAALDGSCRSRLVERLGLWSWDKLRSQEKSRRRAILGLGELNTKLSKMNKVEQVTL